MDSPENKLQTILDLAKARLLDSRVTDENVRSDLNQIVECAIAALKMLGAEPA